MKAILYIALAIAIFTYMFWSHFPEGTFYIGNALFIFLISMYLFCHDNNSFIIFTIFALSIGNLLDELVFDPTKLGINEIVLVCTLPLIWFLKFRKK